MSHVHKGTKPWDKPFVAHRSPPMLFSALACHKALPKALGGFRNIAMPLHVSMYTRRSDPPSAVIFKYAIYCLVISEQI